jgi:GNAT superfamily N-acetyltransferase
VDLVRVDWCRHGCWLYGSAHGAGGGRILCTGHQTIIKADEGMPSHMQLERTGGEAICHDAAGGDRQRFNRSRLSARTWIASFELRTLRTTRRSYLCGDAALTSASMTTHSRISPWIAAGLVSPSYRRRGIGRAMARTLEKVAKNTGYARIASGTSAAGYLLERRA